MSVCSNSINRECVGMVLQSMVIYPHAFVQVQLMQGELIVFVGR